MNTLRHNRPLAVAALVLITALSLVLGTMRSVAALAAKTEKVYAKDSDKYGSPKADLPNIVKWAGDLNAISVATDSGDLTPEISALRDALSSPVGQGDKALALYTAASAAYGRITANKDVSEAQRNSATLAFYDIRSTMERLKGNEDYHRAAEKYNSAIGAFPGSLLGRKPAAEYGY